MKNFERITVDPAGMNGVPCIRHIRIPVATILRLLAGGLSEQEILCCRFAVTMQFMSVTTARRY
jgi:uncharacterized protein (DUF433 family)